MISSFGNAVLSREQMKKETGGVDRYWAYNDNADSIAYMTAEAAHNHCMSSIRCTLLAGSLIFLDLEFYLDCRNVCVVTFQINIPYFQEFYKRIQ